MDVIGLDVAINGDIFDLFIKNPYKIKNNQKMALSIKNKDLAIIG